MKNLTRLFSTIIIPAAIITMLSAQGFAVPLLQLTFKDQALTNCIAQLVKKNNWHNIQDIKKIKCHGKSIKSALGIEQLTELHSLSLFNNKISSIDLRQLTQLEHVNIANNKLKHIELAHLKQLKTLYLFKNKLTTVNFSGLIQLKKIRITNNKLSTLDISELTALEKAYFFDNKLKDLKVKGLPKLKFIELRQNPMPDEVYDRYDAIDGITIIHDGNADDWK